VVETTTMMRILAYTASRSQSLMSEHFLGAELALAVEAAMAEPCTGGNC
jgi:hypothetical protein